IRCPTCCSLDFERSSRYHDTSCQKSPPKAESRTRPKGEFMQFYIDSADIEEIRKANARGWVDGVTTNPTLISKTGRSNKDVIKDICKEVSGLVSAEVISLQSDEMVQEGLQL